MFAAKSYTSRHYIAIVAMACLCALLGGPSGSVEKVGVEPDPERVGPASWNLEYG